MQRWKAVGIAPKGVGGAGPLKGVGGAGPPKGVGGAGPPNKSAAAAMAGLVLAADRRAATGIGACGKLLLLLLLPLPLPLRLLRLLLLGVYERGAGGNPDWPADVPTEPNRPAASASESDGVRR